MSRKKQQYDWIDDPFNDKKQAQFSSGMTTGSKIAVTIALIIAIIAIFVLIGYSLFGIADVMNTL